MSPLNKLVHGLVELHKLQVDKIMDMDKRLKKLEKKK